VATSKSAWTRAESALARIFGARRRVLSGSANRPDLDGDDSTHERLFLESKLRGKHAVWSTWRAVNARAFKAGKIPVLGLREKHKHGVLLVVHNHDFGVVVLEYLKSLGDQDLLEIEAAVARARSGEDEEAT
jgi:hypothetical protein